MSATTTRSLNERGEEVEKETRAKQMSASPRAVSTCRLAMGFSLASGRSRLHNFDPTSLFKVQSLVCQTTVMRHCSQEHDTTRRAERR